MKKFFAIVLILSGCMNPEDYRTRSGETYEQYRARRQIQTGRQIRDDAVFREQYEHLRSHPASESKPSSFGGSGSSKPQDNW